MTLALATGTFTPVSRPKETLEAPASSERFEVLMERLEKIVARLESSDLPLEDAIEAYQEGVRLAKQGHDRLAEAERRIEEVTGGDKTRPINPEAILGSGTE